jgi:exosortase/archaeosortase family protein
MNVSKDVINVWDLIARYLLIVLLGLGNLYVFYLILTPLTLHGLNLFLGFFYEVAISGNGFVVNGVFFELVTACVGGSAFYLLLILILSSRDVNYIDRIKMILLSFFILYVFNVFRIVLMVYMYGSFYYEFTHWFLWYFISTLFVVILWFWISWLFKVKSVPVYSDFRFLLGLTNGEKKVEKVTRRKESQKKRRTKRKKG